MGYLIGEDYERPQNDKLFLHRVYLKKYATWGKMLGEQICWIPTEHTYDCADRAQRCPEYFDRKEDFIHSCHRKNIPVHHAVAFWNQFLKIHAKLSPIERYQFILSAVCNYGDFFTYATTRAVPDSLVWPIDLDSFSERPSDELRQVVADQIRLKEANLPEVILSTESFDRFRNAWNFYLCTAQRYQEWRGRYDKLRLGAYIGSTP